ncbi:MAG TPA: hypothetical protein VK435_09350, partial [Thermodesulfovibrionales bacterium]|nr:hypothetical protein [Thermodesulfovibrionales bacterium]
MSAPSFLTGLWRNFLQALGFGKCDRVSFFYKGNDFKKTLLALNKLGYTTDAFILDDAMFNPRECARLMGANDYIIKAPINQALFGF